MLSLGAAVILFSIYLYFRKGREKVEEVPAIKEPEPTTPTGQHPYQKLIDRVSGLMIKEIEKSLAKGEFTADITDWKESYQTQMKREILNAIRDHFKEYDNDFELQFHESTFRLKAKIVLKTKVKR